MTGEAAATAEREYEKSAAGDAFAVLSDDDDDEEEDSLLSLIVVVVVFVVVAVAAADETVAGEKVLIKDGDEGRDWILVAAAADAGDEIMS